MEKNYQNFTANLSNIKIILAQDGIENCIKKIKEFLPDFSPKFDLLILLASSYAEIRDDQVKGILTNTEENHALNKLRDRIINFLNQLTEADFSEPPENEESSDPRIGKVKYSIPPKMQLNEETECCVWIAFDEETILKETGETEGEIRNIRISNVMGVELLCHKKGDAFKIETYDDSEQLIEKDLATNWAFYVTPLLEGKYPLILKISIIIAVNGEKINKTKVLREVIQITAEKPEVLEGAVAEKEANGIFLMGTGAGAEMEAVAESGFEGTPPPPAAPSPVAPKRIPPKKSVPSKTTPKKGKKSPIPKGAILGVLVVLIASLLTFNNWDGGGGSISPADTEEKLSWEGVKNSTDTTRIKKYIEENPESEFTKYAKDLLAELQLGNNQSADDEVAVNELNQNDDEKAPLDDTPEKPKQNVTKPINKNDSKASDKILQNEKPPLNQNTSQTSDNETIEYENASRKPIFSSCRRKKKSKQEACTPDAIRNFVERGLKLSKENLNGRVSVSFVINETGRVGTVNVISKTNEKLAEETVKIIKKMPQFLAGQNAKGEPVAVLYELPVLFK